jgi:hypothetical protein
VAALKWNGWQHSAGIGGSFGPEYAAECLERYEAEISRNKRTLNKKYIEIQNSN